MGNFGPIYLDIVTLTYIKSLRLFQEDLHFSPFYFNFYSRELLLP